MGRLERHRELISFCLCGKIEQGKARMALPRPTEKKSRFALFVDGKMGKETQVVLTTLSRLMAAKMDGLISHIKRWVNSQIKITVVRSYHRVLRGA